MQKDAEWGKAPGRRHLFFHHKRPGRPAVGAIQFFNFFAAAGGSAAILWAGWGHPLGLMLIPFIVAYITLGVLAVRRNVWLHRIILVADLIAIVISVLVCGVFLYTTRNVGREGFLYVVPVVLVVLCYLPALRQTYRIVYRPQLNPRARAEEIDIQPGWDEGAKR